jgi:cytochrome c biogenesis protein ResB
MEFSYQADSKYSGFQISRDPGSNLIWVAAILFILGTMSVLYFPYRQVWILYQTQSPDSNRLLIRLGVSKGFNGASELKILAVEMGKGLQTKG